jgi:hypothetical protein
MPRWVHTADVLTCVALVVAVAVTVGDGFRFRFGPVRLAATSPVAPWIVAMILAGVRHLLFPKPTVLTRASALVAAVVRSDAFRAAWTPFLGTRVGVVVVGFLALVTIGYAPGEPRIRLFDDEVMNLPVRWDAGWYFSIARGGYYWSPREHGQQNIAFFPAFPMATRVTARLFGGAAEAYLLAGVVLSHAAFLWALLLLHGLARRLTDSDQAAGAAVLLTACYPFAVFYGAYYTESFFLLGAVGALGALERGRPSHATAFGLLAGLSRPNGFLLAAALALVAWRAARDKRPVTNVLPWLIAVAAPIAGMALYSAYIYSLTGDPLRWWSQHAAWGREFAGVSPFVETADRLVQHGLMAYLAEQPYTAVNAVAATVALALIVPVWRRLGAAYGVFLLVNLVPPIVFGGAMSMGRVTATMFPLFIWLAVALARLTGPLAATFAIFQGLAAALFYTWRSLH